MRERETERIEVLEVLLKGRMDEEREEKGHCLFSAFHKETEGNSGKLVPEN